MRVAEEKDRSRVKQEPTLKTRGWVAKKRKSQNPTLRSSGQAGAAPTQEKSELVERGELRRRVAVVGGLFIGVGEFD
jgi:hypothetical protein